MAGHYLFTRQIKILSCESIHVAVRNVCLNFFSCIKNTSKLIENKNSNTDDSEDCLLNEENDLTKISGFYPFICGSDILEHLGDLFHYNSREKCG